MTATDCAKAVETFLKAQEFSRDVVVVRCDRGFLDRKAMKATDPWEFRIIKGEMESIIESRASFYDTYRILVLMGRVVNAADQDAVDEATDFVEEVAKKFRPGQIIAGGPSLTEIGAGSLLPSQGGRADELADMYFASMNLTFLVTR